MTKRHSRLNRPKIKVVTDSTTGKTVLVRIQPSTINPYDPKQTHAKRHLRRHESALDHIGDIASACEALGIDMLFIADEKPDVATFRFVFEINDKEYCAHWIAARAYWRNGLSNWRSGDVVRVFDYLQLIQQLQVWTNWAIERESS